MNTFLERTNVNILALYLTNENNEAKNIEETNRKLITESIDSITQKRIKKEPKNIRMYSED